MSRQLQRREESRVVSLSYAGAAEANRSFFLRTKLLLPNSAVTFLPRPRLIERLAANLAHPVTLVTANAGSGKTALVADFVRSQTHPYLWYQLDHTDADPAVFLSYIVHGMRQIIEDFGQATLDYLRQEAAEVNQHPERAVDVMISDLLDRIDEEMILVLDDYSSLGSATKVHVAVERLLCVRFPRISPIKNSDPQAQINPSCGVIFSARARACSTSSVRFTFSCHLAASS
jgi:ATP/maltotriose-dependent transcriptional regulator MalT